MLGLEYKARLKCKGDGMRGEVVIKEAKKHGNGAAVLVPKRWINWRVRCEVMGRFKKEASK